MGGWVPLSMPCLLTLPPQRPGSLAGRRAANRQAYGLRVRYRPSPPAAQLGLSRPVTSPPALVPGLDHVAKNHSVWLS